MKVIIKRVNNFFLQDTKTLVEIPMTEEEFMLEYSHKTELPYVNDEHELVYVVKESELKEE